MLPGRLSSFSCSTTCMISEPGGGSRSCLDWTINDEWTKNDFKQYGSRFEELNKEADELADALEKYKLIHRRRYISFEEMLAILRSLGYKR